MNENLIGNKIYTQDLLIAKAIIARDAEITFKYLYEDCYPMFKAIFNRYYTDCQNCKEFIDEIYILIMTPGSKTGKVPLLNYRGDSSLKTWLRIAAISYCIARFKKRINTVEINKLENDRNPNNLNLLDVMCSVGPDLNVLDRMDKVAEIKEILNKIKNHRYREILRLRLIEQKEHQEVAEILGMTMPNYYNKRKLAQKQYDYIKKEMKL